MFDGAVAESRRRTDQRYWSANRTIGAAHATDAGAHLPHGGDAPWRPTFATDRGHHRRL